MDFVKRYSHGIIGLGAVLSIPILLLVARDPASCSVSGAREAQVLPIGDTLTVIQRPLVNIPSIVTPGDTLCIECEADPSTSGWAASLVRGSAEIPLTLFSASYDASTEWWTLLAVVPPVPLYELYDLEVSANGGLEDVTWDAVQVIEEFKSDYYFVHITDPHLPTHLYYYQSGADTDSSELQDLRAVIDDINIIHPEFVLLTGDYLNEGELEDYLSKRYYTRAQKALTEFDVPVFLTSGNHDLGGWDDTPPSDGTARRDWWRFFGWKRLDDPPAGAPERTQDYSFDYGPVHYVGLEAYINYDRWRQNIYGYDSFTSDQLRWLSDDLDEAAGSAAQVLFYHYDFSDQISLSALQAEMALSGHIHRDEGSISSAPYDLITNNVCDGERAYRLVRVSGGTLDPSSTISAGSSGQNLTVVYSPSNDGSADSVTATVDNNLSEAFEHGMLRFLMPPGATDFVVTGGALLQTDSTGSATVCYVGVDIGQNSTQMVTVVADPAETTIADGEVPPSPFRLAQNIPNPFNPSTEIRFSIPEAGLVRLSIFDVRGREVAVLVDEGRSAGEQSASWSGVDDQGTRAPSSVYFARLQYKGRVLTRTIALIR